MYLIRNAALCVQDPLHRAAENGETMECSHLLEVDLLDVDGRDGIAFPTTPLHLAARYGHADVVKLLLNKGGNMRLQRCARVPLPAAKVLGGGTSHRFESGGEVGETLALRTPVGSAAE